MEHQQKHMIVGWLVILISTALKLYSNEVKDTIVGNLQLEWMRIPERYAPDSCRLFLPDDRYVVHPMVHAWPAEVFWLRDDRIGIIYPRMHGFGVESYDTSGMVQVHGSYLCPRILKTGYRYAWQCRQMRNGNVGLWGCMFDPDQRFSNPFSIYPPTAAGPLFYQLDSTLSIERVIVDTSRYYQTQPLKPNWLQTNIGSVLPYDALSISGQACYIQPDKAGGWWLVVYSEDLQRKIAENKFTLPFAATIRDSLNRDSVYLLNVVPYAISQTRRGIAGWSRTVDGERVLVIISGENFNEIRAVKLPYVEPNTDMSSEREITYFVEDGYIVDVVVRAGRLQIVKVWDNGVVEWRSQAMESLIFNSSTRSRVYIYRVRKSHWGGWYRVGTYDDYSGGQIAFFIRYNGWGRINGYYVLRCSGGCISELAMSDAIEHYRDSSIYVVGQIPTPRVSPFAALTIWKFRFRPSDTSSVADRGDPNDTTLSVDGLSTNGGGVTVSPQPVRGR